ncbi:hypothetical protein YC2023_061305 [Brassica napus]
MQNRVRLEMASQEEDVMDSIETSRIQIVEPRTESFPAAGEGNWSLVSGKQPGVSMGSPKFQKDDDVTLLGSPSRFSPLLDLEQEDEDLEKQYEEDKNHVVEEIEEGELVEKKEVQPKTEGLVSRNSLIVLCVVNLLGLVFTLLVPESKGKSLEDMSGENENNDENSISSNNNKNSKVSTTA